MKRDALKLEMHERGHENVDQSEFVKGLPASHPGQGNVPRSRTLQIGVSSITGKHAKLLQRLSGHLNWDWQPQSWCVRACQIPHALVNG